MMDRFSRCDNIKFYTQLIVTDLDEDPDLPKSCIEETKRNIDELIKNLDALKGELNGE